MALFLEERIQWAFEGREIAKGQSVFFFQTLSHQGAHRDGERRKNIDQCKEETNRKDGLMMMMMIMMMINFACWVGDSSVCSSVDSGMSPSPFLIPLAG